MAEPPDDPLLPLQWYIDGSHYAVPRVDLNVRPVWQDYSGRGVTIGLGTDGAVKVWLNGQLVHTNKSFRPLSEAADTVNVSLNAGANDLLLKIVQGSGGWGVCCGVKAADGGNIAELGVSAP